MTGLFPFYKLILEEGNGWSTKWKDILKQTPIQGPKLAQMVSNLETLTGIFNREGSLLSRLIYTKHNQLKTSTYWRHTRQLNTRVKALKLEELSSNLQFLHLQFSLPPTKKPQNPSPLVLAFPLHQIRSTHWICGESCKLIVVAYAQYRGMIEMAHFMPILLALMAVLSRLYIIFSRIESICTTIYNTISQHLSPSLDRLTSTELETWTEWVGPLPLTLESLKLLNWQEEEHPASKNQKALDDLNRALHTTSDDDLGEELEFSSEIPQSLVYIPPTSTPAKKQDSTPKVARAEPVASTPTPKSKIDEVRMTKKPAAPGPPPVFKTPNPTDLKEKHKDKYKDKKKNKASSRPESTDLFDLLSPASRTSQPPQHKEKKDKRKADYLKETSSSSEGSKKRKKPTDEDEIDDLFNLLSAPKKPKT